MQSQSNQLLLICLHYVHHRLCYTTDLLNDISSTSTGAHFYYTDFFFCSLFQPQQIYKCSWDRIGSVSVIGRSKAISFLHVRKMKWTKWADFMHVFIDGQEECRVKRMSLGWEKFMYYKKGKGKKIFQCSSILSCIMYYNANVACWVRNKTYIKS